MFSRNIGVIAILISLQLSATNVLAQIYKTTDAQGNVVFTDVPPKDKGNAVKIDAGNFYQPDLPVAAPAPASQAPGEEQEPPASYEQLRITSPGADEPVRENAGNLTVTVSSSPSLDTSSGHSMQILLDGNVLASGSADLVTLDNVDRGTHLLTAQIVDSDGATLITSDPVEFHMLRFAVSMRKPRPAN